MAKAIELRPARRRPVPAGQALDHAPPEGKGPLPYGLSGDGPVVAVVRQPGHNVNTMPDALIELAIDFIGDKQR